MVTTPLSFATGSHDGLSYRLHTPVTSRAAPFILFLHGVGECGSDNAAQVSYPFFAAEASAFTAEPAFVLAPQAPTGTRWIAIDDWRDPKFRFAPAPTAVMAAVLGLLDRWRTVPGVDPKRFYVAGLSMGGYGVFDLVARGPERFAAAIAVCGRGDVTTAGRLRDVPFWVAHGAVDPLVPAEYSREMVAALRAVGGQAEHREYADEGHGVWNRAFTDIDLCRWLPAQRR